MAANSGGSTGSVDWNTLIKPFVTYSVGSLTKQEVVSLIKSIVEAEKDIQESADTSHPNNFFYDIVTVLTPHVVISAVSNDLLVRSHFPIACQAMRILCESLVSRLKSFLHDPHPYISAKLIVGLFQELCTGDLMISNEDFTNLLTALKATELPGKISSSAPSSWDKDCTSATGKEVRRNRLDPSVLLYDQISIPMLSIPAEKNLKDLMAVEVTQILKNLRAGQKCADFFLKFRSVQPHVPGTIDLNESEIYKASHVYQNLKQGSVDLNSLVDDFHWIHKVMSLPLFAPLNPDDSHLLNKLIVGSLNVAFAVLYHIQSHLAGNNVKQSSGSVNMDPEFTASTYALAVRAVAHTMWIQRQSLHILKNDENLPQWTFLNGSLVLSKFLFTYMQIYMARNPSVDITSFEKSSQVEIPKVALTTAQVVWNELAVSIVRHGVDVAASFITLADVNDGENTERENGNFVRWRNFQNEQQLEHRDRIEAFFSGSVNVIELVVQAITLTYRKACRIKATKASHQGEHGSSGSANSKNVFWVEVEDDSNGNNLDSRDRANHRNDVEVDNYSVSDIMTTEDEEDRDDENDTELDRSMEANGDNDDEPYLGKWFQSVLNPPDSTFDDNGAKGESQNVGEDSADDFRTVEQNYIVPKDDPRAIMEAAVSLLKFMTKHLLPSKNFAVRQILSKSLNEQTVTLVALILKDLDHEKSNTDTGAISTMFDDNLNRTYVEFSNEFAKMVQNLLAQGQLTEPAVICLLSQMGIELHGTGRWFLGLQARALAVMVQHILLKPQDKEVTVVSILRRTLDTLVQDVSCVGPPPEGYSDLPVEHAQTLVFLFHTLSLMQKKAIMIDAAKAVINASARLKGRVQHKHQLLSLSRLLLLFDYLIRQLYEPSLPLISHVQYNLFNDESGASALASSSQPTQTSADIKGMKKKKTPQQTAKTNQQSNDLNAKERPNSASSGLPAARWYYENPITHICGETLDDLDCGMRPKFYNLIKVEASLQENPRLDGLAMNFLMNKNDTKEKVSYQDIIEAVLRLLELEILDTDNVSAQLYIQYFLTRLVFGLPPPHEFILLLDERGTELNWVSSKAAFVVYMIIWLPRLQNRVYVSWIRDIFTKQGLTSNQSDDIAKRAGTAGFAAKFVLPALQAVLHWTDRGCSGMPVYFLACEAAVQFAHENMEEYFSFENNRSQQQETKEAQYVDVFIRILKKVLAALQKEITDKGFITPRLMLHTEEKVDRNKCYESASKVLAIGSSYLHCNRMAKVISEYLDPGLLSVINEELPIDFRFEQNQPELNSKKPNSDVTPGESYLLTILNGYAGHKVSRIAGLRHLLYSVIKLCGAGIHGKHKKKTSSIPLGREVELQQVLHPLLLDRTAEFVGSSLANCIDSAWCNQDMALSRMLHEVSSQRVIELIIHPELRAVIPPDQDNAFLAATLTAISSGEFKPLDYVAALLGKEGNGDQFSALVNMLMELKDEAVTAHICEFLAKIFDSSSGSPSSEQPDLVAWFREKCSLEGDLSLISILPEATLGIHCYKNENTVQSACKMIASLSNILRSGNKNTRKAIVSLLLSCMRVTESNLLLLKESESSKCEITASFPHVLKLLIKVATQADGPEGHTHLFKQAGAWFMSFLENLDSHLVAAVRSEQGSSSPWVESLAILTDYLLNIGKALQAVRSTQLMHETSPESSAAREPTPGTVSPPNEVDENFEMYDSEVGDDGGNEDEDSGAEDSDDEGLNSRLCTYTVTQKDFMSQHWYHCHSCEMTDTVGVCSICARVCHRGHDVTYAKFGSFFCDCGAKTDGSCKALLRRTSGTANDDGGTSTNAGVAVQEQVSTSPASVSGPPNGNQQDSSRRTSSPTVMSYNTALATAASLFKLSNSDSGSAKETSRKEKELGQFNWDEIMQVLKDLGVKMPMQTISKLEPVVEALAETRTPIGAYMRVRSALQKLRYNNEALLFTPTEELMIPTLGSQEGAFENVKLQYNGDQGSTIRQLINAQVIRRTTISALSAPAARRNYLAVSQEKGKLTILQLGALLSGAEVGRKKLTLPRLATLSLPFTALTMATNPLRDDVIAVCGLKDCHVLVISSGGTISNHFVLQPQVESQNHIIKPLWIPGSQTELAIITSDAVKIYDLSKDTISPMFYFLLPTGKVRDATFVVQGQQRYVLIMSFDGRLFYEKLSENTSATHGYYYVTNDLNFQDTEMLVTENTATNSSDNKGVSIYYSHSLKLLFYTYPNGKSYVGTLDDLEELDIPLSKGVLIAPKQANSKNSSLGLAYWTDVPGHPGLVFAIGSNSVPYVLLLTEKGSYIQEFRMQGKVKPIDIIALRHWSKPDKTKTSLMILCDDGSLRVCDASEITEFWLNPRLRPHIDTFGSKPILRKTTSLGGKRGKQNAKLTNGKLVFPVDFFEHCQPIQDVEFGGNDLLQVYNPAQIRNRLNSQNTYIASTKSTGFNLEISCSDPSMVITGIRVYLGNLDVVRAPTFIQVFGRTINVMLTEPRWYDVPFTREETIQADNKVSIMFGPSNERPSVTFVNSVKVYGKTKDSFGWPEDAEDIASAAAAAANSNAVDSGASNSGGNNAVITSVSGFGNNGVKGGHNEPGRDRLVEKIVTNLLEVCEVAAVLYGKEIFESDESCVKMVTQIYLKNYTPISNTCKAFMSTILSNKGYYHEYKDSAAFDHYMNQIVEMREIMQKSNNSTVDMDPEAFHHIVAGVKNIAVTRSHHLIDFDYDSWNERNMRNYSLKAVVIDLVNIFMSFVNQRPDNPHIVSVDRPGIQRVEVLSMCIADTIYSLMSSDISLVQELSRPLLDLLLCNHKDVSVPVRQLFTKRLRPKSARKRRVTIPGPSPPHCTSPDTAAQSPREVATPSENPNRSLMDPANLPLVEVDAPIVMLDQEQENEGQIPMLNPLEAFMGPDGFIAPGLDLQSDAEDEAMVELAIALSLQEQVGGAALAIQGIQEGLHALDGIHQEALHVAEAISPPEEAENLAMDVVAEGGGESDATASPPPSDDEGSTVATEGSTMRNSEPGGSESSGSSNAGSSAPSTKRLNSQELEQLRGEVSGLEIQQNIGEHGASQTEKLALSSEKGAAFSKASVTAAKNAKPFRLGLMKIVSEKITSCEDPLSTIPLLQVLLVIITELDGTTEEEKIAVECMVNQLLSVMNLETPLNLQTQWARDRQSEITLISLRMLSILVSRWRQPDVRPENNWISKITADLVHKKGLMARCKELLLLLRTTWKGNQDELPTSPTALATGGSSQDSTGGLLRPSTVSNPPDYGPFFLKQYVKSHSHDILEELPLLLSEMALRFPYQVKKIIPQEAIFDETWEELLCEMLQNRNAPFVRRQARKLLLNIAGTREKYHLLRDLHNIKHNLSEFKKLICFDDTSKATRGSKPDFKYSQLVSMVEHLNTCIDIATQRPASWQTHCRNEDSLDFILQVSCSSDDSFTTAILTLLKIAIDGVAFDSKSESPMATLSEDEKKDKSLAHRMIDNAGKRTFLEFLKRYLLEHPVLSTRWQAHNLTLGFFSTSDSSHQLKLVHAMWELWPFVPAAGVRAAQFVDILGYATLNNDLFKATDLRSQVRYCINSIESQGNALLAHPNACIYSSLVPFVSVEGFYLESEPCEVCFNIDKPYSTQKLLSIRADGKFTANSMICKLVSTLSVIRLSIRLADVKKARMVKTMAVYYSPKNLPIVELKNKPNLWQMARKVVLSPSQTEVKLDFSVPITAANIMLEFLDFYENVQATAETLQCPRCSASVPAQPGVCSNCGENVYQCHKCRAINYDERDPFLCHSCGFCKYAKMDISLLAKNVVAVDPIENEEDHKKAETAVSSLLEKADQTYKQQQQMKSCLESMLQSIKERRSMAGVSLSAASALINTSTAATNSGSATLPQSYAAVTTGIGVVHTNGAPTIPAGTAVNPGNVATTGGQNIVTTSGASSSLVLKNVQSLAYCYAIDCKNSYEELNRLMRKVSAYRREMLKIDSTSYSFDTMDNITSRRCYGCMASSITLSLKLLQALITAGSPRDPFHPDFLCFLLRLSQSAGSTALKEQVKNALCFFVKDDNTATVQLTNIITSRVLAVYNKETWTDLSFETSEELSLLSSLLQMYDACWEIKLRSLMEIFTYAVTRVKDSSVMETSLLPCLKIIQNFIRATQNGDKNKAQVQSIEGVSVNLEAWLRGDRDYAFENWRKHLPKIIKLDEARSSGTAEALLKKVKPDGKLVKKVPRGSGHEKPGTKSPAVEDARKLYLIRTYGRLWLRKFYKLKLNESLNFDSECLWIKKLIFCPGSVQTRVVTTTLLKDLCGIPQRRLKIMELLTSFMHDLPMNGECCREFMQLYRDLATPAEYSAFLNAKGALQIVCRLLDDQIEKLHYLEVVTLHSDLSEGIAIWELSRLLSSLAIPSVRRNKRVSLLSTVLGGYLALKRLKLHRTRPIEEAQEILLQLLEEITSGTEEEIKIFMSVCVETLKKCPNDDLTTPVFVFERVCSLIVHEENEVAEFFVSLEKDPQQEDFLQGRMFGNPYSSNETGIGPLMRDIKNKICTDCELVALLEDDNGMELLVNNRIISLDLPVKEVYKRIWLPTNGQIEPMRIVYRMRGLLGDATEEFVESFASPSDDPEDNEAIYKHANILVDCGGLKVALSALVHLMKQPFTLSKAKPLIAVILKLLGYTAKIKTGRTKLVDAELNCVQTLLPILKLCLQHDMTIIQGSSGIVHLTDQVLEILDVILSDACGMDETSFRRFESSRGSIDDVKNLLALTSKLKNGQNTMAVYLRVLACLTYTDKEKMILVFDSYKDCCDFFKYDGDTNPEMAVKLEQWCTLVTSIHPGPYGNSFKDLALERKNVETCLDYIRVLAPNLKPPMGRPDSDEWKDMISKPSLKYVMRLLAGFAANHPPTQEALSETIYVIHQLEQVSSDEYVGTLAENVLEALRSHQKIWKEVEAARRATREEKKRMAMAMRQKQLLTMGMKTNDKGQVTAAASTMLDQMEDLAEETGLVCVICREGYKYQPTKVLGIYTYSKRCLLEKAETKTRKTYGYCTVSHFNVVHIDCHMAAIRLARSRDEWESASLQNANTRCNGLIPLWGIQVPEPSFAASLARHNAYLQEATGYRDVGFGSEIHDIKLLLLRFAEEKPFHEDAGGGGPESNMHLVPYLVHTALYVLNTTRAAPKETRSVEAFLSASAALWKEDAYAVDGVYYHLVVFLVNNSYEKWMKSRFQWLKRVVAMNIVRSKKQKSAKFEHYRVGLIFIGLIHGLYTIVFKDVSVTGEWPSMLADFIRKHDEPMLKTTTILLNLYQEKMLTAQSLNDFCSILDLGNEVELQDTSGFLNKLCDDMGI